MALHFDCLQVQFTCLWIYDCTGSSEDRYTKLRKVRPVSYFFICGEKHASMCIPLLVLACAE